MTTEAQENAGRELATIPQDGERLVELVCATAESLDDTLDLPARVERQKDLEALIYDDADRPIPIADDAQRDRIAELSAKVMEDARIIKKKYDPLCSVLSKAHKAATGLRATLADSREGLARQAGQMIVRYNREAQRKHEAELARLRREEEARAEQARKDAEAEQARKDAEALTVAEEFEAEGDAQGAAEILAGRDQERAAEAARPVVYEPEPLPPPPAPMPKAPGVSGRANYRCVVTDLKALMAAALENPMLMGQLAPAWTETAERVLSPLAKTQKEAFRVPGCRAEDQGSATFRAPR